MNRPNLPTRPSAQTQTQTQTLPTQVQIRRSSIHLEDYSPLSNLEEWTVLECIGKGSFGVIHKVQRKGDGYIAAMKQLDYSKLSPKDRRQMVEEVRILGSLRNKHVVQLIDKIMDMQQLRCYIIMEYCGGGDLSRILDGYRHRSKTIPESLVWSYFIQLTQALHHCHYPEDRNLPSSSSSHPGSLASGSGSGSMDSIPSSSSGGLGERERKSSIVPGREMGMRRKLESLGVHPPGDPLGLGLGLGAGAGVGGTRRGREVKATGQVLHRDLKPENIFLDEQDNIKLGDFGLSKNLAAGSFTQTYVGTPLYMPPEILKESKYDHKSDIWSLGCLVYELCTLSSPFASAKSQSELLTKVMHSKWSPIGPSYSSGLRDLVTRMLSIDPARRPSTKDLQNSPDMKLWKKEYDRRHAKAENDRLAADLEKRLDQIIALRDTTSARERACAERMQTLDTRENDLVAQQEHIETVWRREQDRMSKYKDQLDAEFEDRSKELQDELSRARTRSAELAAKEKDLAARERELTWGRRELEVGRADLEAAIARWKLEKGSASGSDVKLPQRSQSTLDVTEPITAQQATARPPLQERSTVPNVALNTSKPRKSSPLNNPSLDFMDLDSPARGRFGGTSPSLRSGIPRASPRSDAVARNGTPLRSAGRLATKSFNDLRARAKLDSESATPSSPVLGGNDSVIMMDFGTPLGQIRSRSRPNDFVGEPGFDLDKLQTTNSAKLNQSLAEAARPDCNDIDLLFARAEGKPTDFAARPKIGRPSLNHANTTVATTRTSFGKVSKIPLPTADFVYKENATPAKWSLTNDDVPSPFIKQASAVRPILTGVAAGSPAPRERAMPRLSGLSEGGFRPTSTMNLRKVAIKNRQSGEMIRPEGLMSPGASTVDRLL